MDKYVLDTNLFFNMEEGLNLGKKTEEVIVNITSIMKMMKKKESSASGQFFMPPRIIDEFLSFFEDKNQPFLKEFLGEIIIQSPHINKLQFSASVFYKLIEDIRIRSYRGLSVAEEEIIKAGKMMIQEKELPKKDFEIKIGPVVRSFRERYRQATRYGFLDSLADLDLIVLAKELDASLISTDEGVRQWGRLFGIKEIPVSVFGAKMGKLL